MKQKPSKKEQPRTGKGPDDIFRPVKQAEHKKPSLELPIAPQKEEVHHEEKARARGRPIEHKQEWSKVTVVLLDRQIHWIDNIASNIRLNTKSAVSRAELIRAFIAAVQESGIDLLQLGSEAAVKEALLGKLNK